MTQKATENHPGHTPQSQGPPLTPMPLEMLANRIVHEWADRKKIFDLPTARYWQPDSEVDLSFNFLGRRCATPIGPAAGPHSQLAQNIVLSWLGGSRLFELKTVQILDELEIQRPCIDMQTIGYNIEWSQELRTTESLTEYAKASMLLDILRQWEPISGFVGDDPGPHVFDMSVGYDLDGISSPNVAAFINGMFDATPEVEELRLNLGAFSEYASLDFTTRLSDTLTLSTFHGCPPDEIESITKHLIDKHDLDVIVKLNPTLLGYETVAGIVNDDLGYSDVVVKEEAFVEDLQFERGVELIGELNHYAKERGHKFGIKLTNTLVVDNEKAWMPEETMYLSGPPLHVLASRLLNKLAGALPGQLDIPGHAGDIMVSFSAGVNKDNLADTLAMGVNPATVCSDLLKPGGYGRLAPMLKALTREIAESGSGDLVAWRQLRQASAEENFYPNPCAEHVGAMTTRKGKAPYHFDSNTKLPREVEHDLEMFGCVACNFCITVCPNDAFFSIATPDSLKESLGDLAGRQQYFVLSELCNECGNCMTFCPENGDPAVVKPRLYTNADLFASRTGQGLLLSSEGVLPRDIDHEAAALVESMLKGAAGIPLGQL